MKKLLFCLAFVFYSSTVLSQNVDCENPEIKNIIASNNSVILNLTGPECARRNDHICLSSDISKKEQVNKMYSLILAHYMAGKRLSRISYDTSVNVSGCGYPLVTEVR